MRQTKPSAPRTQKPVRKDRLKIPLPEGAENESEFDAELEMGEVEEPLALVDESAELGAEPIDLADPALASELSEDPVRLYLREIGQVKLLDADSEFRLDHNRVQTG
jgi:RNA polymerase primary sigma factor